MQPMNPLEVTQDHTLFSCNVLENPEATQEHSALA